MGVRSSPLVVVAAGAAALLLAGCAVGGGGGSSRLPFAYVSPRGMLLWTSSKAVTPVVRHASAFAAPRRPGDRLPQNRVMLAMLRTVAANNKAPAVLGRSRLLVSGVGARDERLYGVPSVDGSVTLVLVPPGTAPARVPGLVGHVGAVVQDADGLGGDPAVVYGIVDETVAGIDVVVDGETHPAKLGRSAFAYELEDARVPDSSIEAVVVRTSDAGKQRLTLDWKGISEAR
jgi:hypothetical protein